MRFHLLSCSFLTVALLSLCTGWLCMPFDLSMLAMLRIEQGRY